MKIIHAEISHCIASISRISFRETKYPSRWKVGRVTTLFKSGVREDCENYRHYRLLTMLSIPSKITKSVICEYSDQHLQLVLQQNQWGYRKGLSSESLSLYLTEMWKLFTKRAK